MDAHGVEVFDGADNDDVVRQVAHHLQLKLFPPNHAFFDEHLCGGRQIQPLGHDVSKLVDVVGDSATRTAEGVGRTDDGRKPNLLKKRLRLGHVVSDIGLGTVQANLLHGFFEEGAILSEFNGLRFGANKFASVLLQDPIVEERHGQIQSCLATHGRQDGIWTFSSDDLLTELRRQGFHVSGIRHLRIRHDGRRIGIDQNDFVAQGLERLAGLGARIVKLTGLADHNRATSNDENPLYVGSFRHYSFSPSPANS